MMTLGGIVWDCAVIVTSFAKLVGMFVAWLA